MWSQNCPIQPLEVYPISQVGELQIGAAYAIINLDGNPTDSRIACAAKRYMDARESVGILEAAHL